MDSLLYSSFEKTKKKPERNKKRLRSDAKLKLFASPITNEPRRFKLIHTSLFGFSVQNLLECGAVLNLLLYFLDSQQNIDALPTTKKIICASDDSSGLVTDAREVNARFESVTVMLDFSVVDKPPVDVIIGCFVLEAPQVCSDLEKQCVKFHFQGQKTELPLSFDRNVKRSLPAETESENFTSDVTPSEDSDDEGNVAWLSRDMENTYIDRDGYEYPLLCGCSLSDKLVDEESEDKSESYSAYVDDGNPTEKICAIAELAGLSPKNLDNNSLSAAKSSRPGTPISREEHTNNVSEFEGRVSAKSSQELSR